MDQSNTTAYWVAGIIIVLLAVAGIWWWTAQDTSPLVPNTGTTTSEGMNDADYLDSI